MTRLIPVSIREFKGLTSRRRQYLTIRCNKKLQTYRRIRGRIGAYSSRCRRTCCRIRGGCSDRPGNIRPLRRWTCSCIMIIRETCKWWQRGGARSRWYGGRQGCGTAGLFGWSWRCGRVAGWGVWRVSREKVVGGDQSGQVCGLWAREWLGVELAVQNLQKKIYFHENEHDGRHIYVERQNRDNNKQDTRNYNLRTHKKMNESPTYEHDTDAKTENKDTQKYVIKSTIKQTFKGRLILKDKSRHAINEIYRRFKCIIPKS
jgi:hypothetical protein